MNYKIYQLIIVFFYSIFFSECNIKKKKLEIHILQINEVTKLSFTLINCIFLILKLMNNLRYSKQLLFYTLNLLILKLIDFSIRVVVLYFS